MKTLRHHRQLLGWFMICLMATWLPGPHAQGATLFYDGFDGPWDTTTSQWNSNSATWTNGSNIANFTTAPAGTVSLSEAITAGGMIFGLDGYRITGGADPVNNTLTLIAPTGLNSPVINVASY